MADKRSRFRIDHDLALLLLVATARFVFHLLTNGAYGFHRDELAVIDDARYLAWGYVAYPPFTPVVARVALELFGLSTTGFRMFGALAQCAIMVLTGLMARELGARRHFQIIAAVAVAIAPMSMVMTSLFQYITFDAFWWVVVAWALIKVIRTDDPRWWLAIGAAIGLGMMTKYTMAFWVLGLVGGVLLTPLRRHLRSGWLWLGVALSLVIFLPNFLWQFHHDWVSLEFLKTIHERDVSIGRTEGFLSQQFYVSTSLVTIPLWLAGLWYFLFDSDGRRFRALGWMYLIVFAVMAFADARFYYLTPAYPMLMAGGVVPLQRWLSSSSVRLRRVTFASVWTVFAFGAITSALLMLPLAPIGSTVWKVSSQVHDNFSEQLGWHELTGEVARIYNSLSQEERARAGIHAGNYGEAAAINLFGPRYGLPTATSGINSYWYRGFQDPPPEIVILLGSKLADAAPLFESCEVAGSNRNRYGVENEESRDHPDILLCRGPRFDWSKLWPKARSFG